MQVVFVLEIKGKVACVLFMYILSIPQLMWTRCRGVEGLTRLVRVGGNLDIKADEAINALHRRQKSAQDLLARH